MPELGQFVIRIGLRNHKSRIFGNTKLASACWREGERAFLVFRPFVLVAFAVYSHSQPGLAAACSAAAAAAPAPNISSIDIYYTTSGRGHEQSTLTSLVHVALLRRSDGEEHRSSTIPADDCCTRTLLTAAVNSHE